MKTKTRIAAVVASAVGVFAVILVVMSILHSERVDAITVTFIGPGEEVRDKPILGIGKKDLAPDYRLDVVHTGGKHRCATVPNRSAAQGIKFTVAKDVPVSQIQELVLVEADPLGHQTMARVQLSGKAISADGYRFDVASSRSFKVGLDWFFSTAVGKAISLGVTLGIAIVIVMMFI